MASEYLNNKTFEALIVRFQKVKRERVKHQLFMDDIIATQQRTMRRGRFKKPALWCEVEEIFKKLAFDYENAQDDLAIAFYTLSENIVRYAKFNLIDQDDAIQEGVMICFEKIDRFDPK